MNNLYSDKEREGQFSHNAKLTFLIVLPLFLILLSSAFPLQILPNGTIEEVNLTFNGTIVDIVLYNNSLYIVPANTTNYITNQNITYILSNVSQNFTNITYYNITYVNMTCYNCTLYQNTTNITYVYNNTAFSSYPNREEVSSFISNAINDYDVRSNITVTDYINSLDDEKKDNTWLWISIGVIFLIEIIFFILIARSSE